MTFLTVLTTTAAAPIRPKISMARESERQKQRLEGRSGGARGMRKGMQESGRDKYECADGSV